jgi:DNA-binding LacI/PurR family transcriptional regulator
MKSKPRVRLKDIAAEANLSVAAVSMALRGDRSIPSGTVERVRVIAERLGYAPDPVMSALAAYRSQLRVHREFNVIAFVSNWRSSTRWLNNNSSAQKLVEGAKERARMLGYSLQYFSAWEDGMTPRRLSGVLYARGIRGIIVAPFADPYETFDLDWNRFSIVTIERPMRYDYFHHVVPNYYADMLLVHRELRARGYQRPGLTIDRKQSERVDHQWEAAHIFGHGGVDTARIPTLVLDRDDTDSVFLKWYRQHRPDIVIGRSNVVMRAFRQAGIDVPGEVGYASLNVMDDAPDVSGILQPREVMGATAVDILNTLLHRNHRGPDTVALGTHADGSWHDGVTLRAIVRVRN